MVNGASWVSGRIGTALDFDGVDDEVQTFYPGVSGSQARTVTMLVKSTHTREHGLVAWGDSSVKGARWHLRINDKDKHGVVGAIRTDVEGGYKIGTTNIADGAWHHVVSVFSGNNVTDVVHYVDGVLEGTSGSSKLVG